MIDLHPTIVTAIESATGLQCYYELFCDSSTVLPCVTWNNTNIADTSVGNNLQYYSATYDIKLWAHAIADILPKALLLDTAMKNLGFRLAASNMLSVDNDICMIFSYKCLVQDNLTLNI